MTIGEPIKIIIILEIWSTLRVKITVKKNNIFNGKRDKQSRHQMDNDTCLTVNDILFSSKDHSKKRKWMQLNAAVCAGSAPQKKYLKGPKSD